jgi:hypothetical protein
VIGPVGPRYLDWFLIGLIVFVVAVIVYFLVSAMY